jgi:hypothetical protein
VRLIPAEARKIQGKDAGFEIPVNELVPCSFVYDRIDTPRDLPIAFAYHLEILRRCAAAASQATTRTELATTGQRTIEQL